MSGSGSAATDFSIALLSQFVASGVTDIVVCPGSRSQSLALAAAELERSGLVRLHVRIDERAAGFLALGLAIEGRMPVPLVTTSGTAVANLHPAVLEAHHSGVPMIVLTADRPSDLRGIGANQATDQPGIFGTAVHFVRDVDAPRESGFAPEYPGELAREAMAAALGHSGVPAQSGVSAQPGTPAQSDLPGRSASPGPVQLNLSFREPLSAPLHPLWREAAGIGLAVGTESASAAAAPVTPAPVTPALQPVALASATRSFPLEVVDHTIVIAGHAAGPRAEELARQLGAPLIAEISSGARFGPNLVVAYRQLLADREFGGSVQRAIVFGHPTLSREVPALLERAGVEVVIVRGTASEAYNPGRRASRIVDAVDFDGQQQPRDWVGRWVHASRAILDDADARDGNARDGNARDGSAPGTTGIERPQSLAREQLAVYRQPVTRRMLAGAIWRVTWPHDRLVLGASRLIRDADRSVPGKRISVHANRGLAGIDGTISTAAGIAIASEAAGSTGTTRVLLGDLTLLHDAGSMLFGEGERRPRLQVIVGNDGGGSIFDGLEVSSTAPKELFDRVQFTPHAVRFKSLAKAYGWDYLLASNRGELDSALAPSDRPMLIEVPLRR